MLEVRQRAGLPLRVRHDLQGGRHLPTCKGSTAHACPALSEGKPASPENTLGLCSLFPFSLPKYSIGGTFNEKNIPNEYDR